VEKVIRVTESCFRVYYCEISSGGSAFGIASMGARTSFIEVDRFEGKIEGVVLESKVFGAFDPEVKRLEMKVRKCDILCCTLSLKIMKQFPDVKTYDLTWENLDQQPEEAKELCREYLEARKGT
jgi:hypothetical protein